MLQLKDVNGSELINILNQLFDKNKFTGFVSAENPDSNIVSKIFIEEGQITYAISTMYRARFGDLMIKKGIITPKELNSALKIQKEDKDKPLIGNILVTMGVISERVIPNLLYHQIEVVIYEILTWKNVDFSFEEYNIEQHPEYRRPVSKSETKAAYNDLSKLMDSRAFIKSLSTSVNEIVKIRQYLSTPDNVPKRISKDYPVQLTFDQRKILRAIDGINTLNDIIILSDLDYFRTYQIIYSLALENVISIPGVNFENTEKTEEPHSQLDVVPASPEKPETVENLPAPEIKQVEENNADKVITPISEAEMSAMTDYEKDIRNYKEEIKQLKQKINQLEESKALFNDEISQKVASLAYNKKIILTNIIKNILDLS